MIWYKLYLVHLVSVTFLLEVHGQYQQQRLSQQRKQPDLQKQLQKTSLKTRSQDDRDRSGEIQIIKQEMDKIAIETDNLNKENEQLNKNLSDIENNCDSEVSALNNKLNELMAQAIKYHKTLEDLLRKIQEEETVHIQLEEELKRVSEYLELFECQQRILFGNLKLMELRRTNGTTLWCTDLTHDLDEDEQGHLMTRAHIASPFKVRQSKLSKQDMEIITLKNKLRIQTMLRDKIAAIHATTKRSYKASLELCTRKKENVNKLIEETIDLLTTSEASIQLLQRDLEHAIAFSEAVRLEVKSAKAYINDLSIKTENMKNAIQSYSEDNVCFQKIKERD